MTAQENVEMPMILKGTLSQGERKKRAVELLTKVGMGQRLDHLPAQLSGGEQQRVRVYTFRLYIVGYHCACHGQSPRYFIAR